MAVHILTKEKFLSADKHYEVECKSSGSRPEAVITWWMGARQIKRMVKNVSRVVFQGFCKTESLSCLFQFSESGNQSSSVLTFSPTMEDDGKYLACRAENPFVPDSSIEDKWQMVVHRECRVQVARWTVPKRLSLILPQMCLWSPLSWAPP